MKNHEATAFFTNGNDNLISNGLILCDLKGICLDINQAALKILRKNKNKMVGSDLHNLFLVFFEKEISKYFANFINDPHEKEKTFRGVLLSLRGLEEKYLDISSQKILEEDKKGYILITLNDISVYYKDIIRLKKNKELLDCLLNNTPDIIYVQDLECRNLLVNKRYEEVFNIKKEQVLGKVGCSQPLRVMTNVITNDQVVINTNQPITFEERILHADGYHTYLSTKFPLRDADGVVYAIGGISSDITKTEQQKGLNESLNHIISTIHTPLDFDEIMKKVLVKSAKAIEANQASVSLMEDETWVIRYGYGGLEKWIGDHFLHEEIPISRFGAFTKSLIVINNTSTDPSFPKSMILKLGVKACIIAPLISREKVIGLLNFNYITSREFNELEIEFVNKLASSISLALDNTFYRDNLETLVQVRTKDLRKTNNQLEEEIKERKRVEEQLRTSQECFAKAFHCNPNLMAITNLKDGCYTEVNASFLNVLGYKSEEVIGKTAIKLKIMSSKARNKIIKQLKEQGEVLSFESKLHTKDGQVRDGLMSACFIELNGEKCLLGVIKDITERNQLLREITRLDQLNLIGEMAAGIGHEIRNPMTTARGFLQMLGTKPDCANYKEYFDIMIEELDRANSIISEFLSMAKDKTVQLIKHNLNKIVTATSSLITVDTISNDKRIKLELEEIPEILLDEKETRQLILNLTRNGLEAMGPEGTLTIKTFSAKGKVVLAISDEGQGIEPGILDKLGTPFFTTKDNRTGLGLAVCYSIAARHKAKIQIETSPTGSTFYIKYPIT